jgi:hypothetical protein
MWVGLCTFHSQGQESRPQQPRLGSNSQDYLFYSFVSSTWPCRVPSFPYAPAVLSWQVLFSYTPRPRITSAKCPFEAISSTRRDVTHTSSLPSHDNRLQDILMNRSPFTSHTPAVLETGNRAGRLLAMCLLEYHSCLRILSRPVKSFTLLSRVCGQLPEQTTWSSCISHQSCDSLEI